MTLCERIEKLRKSRKISQGNLEKEPGFSNGSISKWKNSNPTTERLQKLADYFNVSVEYLISGEEKDNRYYLIIYIRNNCIFYRITAQFAITQNRINKGLPVSYQLPYY